MTDRDEDFEAPPPPPVPMDQQRCGFIAVIGAPNAGKSTLVNTLTGTKVSIVSHKVQTTRFRVRGIVMRGTAQLVLVDTPGIFRPKKRIERSMVAAAWGGVDDADHVCLLVDSRKGLDEAVSGIVSQLKDSGRRATLVLNKVDLIKRDTLLTLSAALNDLFAFDRTFMVSALTGDGVEELLAHLETISPRGPWMFPEDEISDLPMRLLAAEITREQVFLQLHEELPYNATVVTEQWQERPDGSVRVEQTLLVGRDTHKGIALGKGGRKIKAIGAAAREELERLLEARVHLFLHVRVEERLWDSRETYAALGLDYDV